MLPHRIEVIAHSGYRSEESPGSFIIHGEKIDIVEILSMWIEEELEDRTRKRYFKVKGSDGYMHKIHYNEKIKEWYYA